jgi:hypothetical protein
MTAAWLGICVPVVFAVFAHGAAEVLVRTYARNRDRRTVSSVGYYR